MFYKILSLLNKIINGLFIFFIKLYQITLSPDRGLPSLWLKGKICSHEPHCSQYAIEYIQRYGWSRSIITVSDRVFNCTPSYIKKYDPTYYKIIFFSSAKIGIPFLDILLKDDRFEVVGVVTQPDQPSGRGLTTQPNIIKKRIEENHPNIDVVTPSKIHPNKSTDGKIFSDWLEDKKPDYLIVIAYGKIIPQSILNIPKIGPINIHGSLLPKYRGASPIQSVFLNGENDTGITIIRMDAGLDTGDIISQKITPISFEDTTEDIITVFEREGPKLLIDTLISYGKGLINNTPQDDELSTFTGKIDKQDGEFDIFRTDIKTIYAKYKAYYLRPKIWFLYQNKRYIVESMIIDRSLFEANMHKPLFEHNTIDKYHLHPSIKELIIKPEGKKAVSYIDRFHSLES